MKYQVEVIGTYDGVTSSVWLPAIENEEHSTFDLEGEAHLVCTTLTQEHPEAQFRVRRIP